ncbi:hypothetical protein [Agromyces seonyuensis]|uniref:Acyl-CoA carboxylase subunit epsilon n=1 Tax=Agromyces seonyuensis TaxID=2662446 RepID=A0A6I4P5W5_9MICO|nr:hypothetical protein [Agromyces seonyuensis]MWB99869.1 hypothetical protein [Agromyces seonyuensis]
MAQLTPPPTAVPDASDIRVLTPGVPAPLAAAATAVVLAAVTERPARPAGATRPSAWSRSARVLRTPAVDRGGWGGFNR